MKAIDGTGTAGSSESGRGQPHSKSSRKAWRALLIPSGFGVQVASAAFAAFAVLATAAFGQTNTNPITREIVQDAEKLIGLEFSDTNLDMMLSGLKNQFDDYKAIHRFPLSNSVPPAILFNPVPVGMKLSHERSSFRNPGLPKIKMPERQDDIAFYSVTELASLIKTRQITSETLTKLYLNRLKTYGPKLECVITLTEDLALKQARRADAELARGRYRGLLHGIPYVAKDLLAVKGVLTTWG